ncbi:Uncharacterized protein conserved in bacteria [Kingella potus]|uniref:Protein Smg homolog n=1 Tax=Kingella potus TaxID=265175 RepID=A0A377R294_9NEIS|nr:DUF494 domain-containing protein [Kingella potus]UOP00595.1 DUF494 domain-containing protein [Kingella potus]STR03010.1 Uncharacterized protein conserved in bacteria [Kingella potus]
MAELIAFLIEHFQNFADCPTGGDLCNILEEVGFGETEIRKILTLVDVLNEESQLQTGSQSAGGLRAYWPEEIERLPAEVRGLLHSLEQAGALDAGQREFVINALMFMPAEEITADTAKVMTLLVLWAQNAELPVLIGDELMAALHGQATMH